MDEPCNWTISYSGCGVAEGQTLPSPIAELSTADRALIETMAGAYLWNWTDQRFGTCEVALRPCRSDCERNAVPSFWGRGPYSRGSASGNGAMWGPALVNGQWFGIACGTCIGACDCDGGAATLALPGPVDSIVEILEDGVALPATAYRVDNHRLLTRLDGGTWRSCQDMLADPTKDTDTWQITYQRGHAVPAGGQVAGGVLALELAKAWCKDNTCALPQRIQHITRQGVTVSVIDPYKIKDGGTGIWIIDSWVNSIMLSRKGGTVHSVDLRKPRTTSGRVTTWQSP